MIIKSFILPYAKMQNLNNIFIICKGMFLEGFQQSAFKKSQGYVLFNSLANKRTLSSMAYVRSRSLSKKYLLLAALSRLFQSTIKNNLQPRPSDKAYFAVVFIACFFLPMGMITVCYYKIYIVSKRIVQNVQAPMGTGRIAMTATRALLKKHRRSAMYFLAIVAVFMFSWSTYAVVSLLVAILGKRLNAIATSACSVFAKTWFVLNPIMYAVLSQRFRRRISLIVHLTRPNPEGRRPAVVPTSSHQLAL